MPARRWVGSVISSPWTTNLATALMTRRRLLEARGSFCQGQRFDLVNPIDSEAAWARLSATYLDVCEEFGQRRHIVAAKLAKRQARLAQSRSGARRIGNLTARG